MLHDSRMLNDPLQWGRSPGPLTGSESSSHYPGALVASSVIQADELLQKELGNREMPYLQPLAAGLCTHLLNGMAFENNFITGKENQGQLRWTIKFQNVEKKLMFRTESNCRHQLIQFYVLLHREPAAQSEVDLRITMALREIGHPKRKWRC